MVEGPVRSRPRAIAWLFATLLAFLAPEFAAAQQAVSIVDTHAHPARFIGRATPDAFVSHALRAMREYGIEKTIVLPPPTRGGRMYRQRWPEFIDLIKAHPNSFAFGAGPEQLNSLILTTPADAVTLNIRRRFAAIARKLIDSGVAVLGEFVAEHFSFGQHPYMSVAPDHPLLLLLADIAARGSVPVDLHMEALPTDRPMPDLWPGRRNPPQTDNPARLRANLPPFERLLAHNTKAKIVWVHAGWDNTGERTVRLMRQLLAKHPNLYMSIKVHRRLPGMTTPFAFFGGIRTEWLELLREFPDRFVIGSDSFYDEEPGDHLNPIRDFVNALPGELARKIAQENAIELYRFNE
ncbi:MAG: amidohydrolase family protein [Deltaproteobacteria bacterium]|nr:amidohydrolase family protein [Deltaproteobacteria bacterium]